MADPTNKWSQPAAPPAPMFFGAKERELVKQVNDELAERVIGQAIAYYPISVEESNFNDIYGEALEKVSLPPIRVYAYVVVENEQANEKYGYDYTTKLTVNFHRKRLTGDQDLFVRVGDFVQYGDFFYEIVRTYNDTRYYFGQVEHKFQISAECVRAREGVFRVEPSLTRPVPTSASATQSTTPAPRAAPYPPLQASYVTILADTKLPNERVLTAGLGISITDGGPNGSVTVATSVTSSTSDINYPIVFTEGFQTDGTLGLGGNTALVYNPNDAILSSSAGAQFVGATILGNTLSVSGNVSIGTSAPTAPLTVQGNVDITGSILPGADDTYDLGAAAYRWDNLYVTDLHLANERGDWTMIEEHNYLTIRNNKSGKRFKLLMEEIED